MQGSLECAGWCTSSAFLAVLSCLVSGTATRGSEEAARDLRRIFGALEAVHRSIPRDAFDPQAVVGAAGSSPEDLFRWVRDETRLVPYRGVLRGARGVLMDRRGNSLDRSLLLMRLLDLGGHESRLARAALAERTAEDLLGAAVSSPARSCPLPAALAEEAIDRLLARAGADRDAVLQSAEGRRVREERLAEEWLQRAIDEADALRALLAGSEAFRPPSGPEGETTIRRMAVDCIRDHWWVQVKSGDRWTDLDTASPTARPGEALVPAELTVAPERLEDELAGLAHTVTIRLVVERSNAGRLETFPILEQSLRAAGVAGERISLRHVPFGWPEDLGLASAADPVARFLELATEESTWLPVLVSGKETAARLAVSVRGTVSEPPLPSFVRSALVSRPLTATTGEGVAALGGRIAGGLGRGRIGSAGAARGDAEGKAAASGLPRPREPAADSALTAEWIEYHIQVPGAAARTVRRALFDLIGPAARARLLAAGGGGGPSEKDLSDAQRLERALALLAETEVLVAAAVLPEAWVLDRAVAHALDTRSAFVELLPEAHRFEAPPPLGAGSSGGPLSGRLASLATARFGWSPHPGRVYLGEPGIFTIHTFLEESADGERNGLRRIRGFDIVANEVSVLPARAEGGAHPFDVRLMQGVADTVGEDLLTPGAGGELVPRDAVTAAGGHAADWTVLAPALPGPLERLELSPDVRALIAQDLEQGYLVVAPRRALRAEGRDTTRWWRIDPATGSTLGRGPRGWGQAAVEGTALLRDVSIPSVEATFKYVLCIWNSVLSGAGPEQANALCLCQFVGDQLTSGLGKVPGLAAERIGKAMGLGELVQFLLGELAGTAAKLGGYPPDLGIGGLCEDLTGG